MNSRMEARPELSISSELFPELGTLRDLEPYYFGFT